jgi:Na(+)-translocating NADH:ubiquinone oxidoreductase F subunit
MNNVLYEIASFMVFRQSTVWRWSHTRHHSDTIIRGRDPEIAVPRPPKLFNRILQHFAIISTPREFNKILLHASGRIHPQVATFLPESEYRKVFLRARIYLFIYASVIGLSIYFWTLLPLFFIGLSNILGSWLMVIYGTTQHAGLEENVLDHRLNSRTVYMNRLHRYLYWNMNYHIEHHMFPLVPYHALPKLHKLIKDDLPKPKKSILDAYREIIPALIKQSRDPAYHIIKELPSSSDTGNKYIMSQIYMGKSETLKDGWAEVCPVKELPAGDVIRFDFQGSTYAIYRTTENSYYGTDGICTHGNTHLAEGLLIGEQIECAKHNGRFNITDGSVKRPPVCVGLKTYAVKAENDSISIRLDKAGGRGVEEEKKAVSFRVISNENVATFIKELILEPVEGEAFTYRPGEYIQFEIPTFKHSLEYIHVNEPYRKLWKRNGTFRLFAHNAIRTKRNYSMASNPETEKKIRFNVRLAVPPEGLNCSAGVGSTYVFNLKPGDTVRAFGPYGDFHIKDTGREMVYIGGGAGMAPLRSQITYLFETIRTNRKVSYWYGARSLNELYYSDHFEELAEDFENFSFNVALSEPKPEDRWYSFTGMIHKFVAEEYLVKHKNPAAIEYYLCGPPAMVSACLEMLNDFGVNEESISYDEF